MCFNCPEYQRAQSNGGCGADECGKGIVQKDGKCDPCPDGQEPDEGKKNCIQSKSPDPAPTN